MIDELHAGPALGEEGPDAPSPRCPTIRRRCAISGRLRVNLLSCYQTPPTRDRERHLRLKKNTLPVGRFQSVYTVWRPIQGFEACCGSMEAEASASPAHRPSTGSIGRSDPASAFHRSTKRGMADRPAHICRRSGISRRARLLLLVWTPMSDDQRGRGEPSAIDAAVVPFPPSVIPSFSDATRERIFVVRLHPFIG